MFISPKGTYVAVCHNTTFDPYTRIIERETGRLVGVFHNPGKYDRRISWSPDETKFVISWWNWKQLHATVCRLDGTVLAEWSHERGEDNTTPVPAWNPDGSRILFVRRESLEQRTPDGKLVESFVTPESGGTPYFQHQNSMWSPDGNRFAIPTDGEVRVYEKDGGEPVVILKHDKDLLQPSCVWNPGGEKILTRNYDGVGTHLWTLSGKSISLDLKDGERATDFSPDGKFLVTNLGGIYDMAGQFVAGLDYTKINRSFVHHETHLRWVDSNRIILFAGVQGPGFSAEFSPTGRKLAEYDHPLPIPQNSLSWMNDTDQLVSVGGAPTYAMEQKTWQFDWGIKAGRDQIDGDRAFQHKQNGGMGFAAFSPDGERYVVSRSTLDATVFNESGEMQYQIKTPAYHVVSSWNSDGSLLATVSSSSSVGGSIDIWRGPKKTARLQGHKHEILGVSWSPDGSYLASWDVDLDVFVWDIQSATEPMIQRKGYGFQLGHANSTVPRWSPNGQRLAVATESAILLVSPSDADDISIPMKTEDLGVIWWRPDSQAIIVKKTMYDLQGKLLGKLSEDNNNLPFLNWLRDDRLVASWCCNLRQV